MTEPLLLIQLTDGRLRGLAEECESQGIRYKALQQTTDKGVEQVLQIPSLKATIKACKANGHLIVLPDEDRWNFWYSDWRSQTPRSLAKNLIRKRRQQLGM